MEKINIKKDIIIYYFNLRLRARASSPRTSLSLLYDFFTNLLILEKERIYIILYYILFDFFI